MEIIHSENGFFRGSILRIFECTGDNAYEQVFVAPPTLAGGTARKVITDFDGDGLVEIAFCASPHVYVYESPSDNTWVLSWAGAAEVSLGDSDGGVDTDGNGKPELFVSGNGPLGWTTMVFEAAGRDSFAPVASFARFDGSTGVTHTTIARLDPAQPLIYIMNGSFAAWMYQSRAVARWEFIGQIPDPSGPHNASQSFDVNQNGRDEIFWTREFGPSFALEQAHLTVDAFEERTSRLRLHVFPNPCRDATQVRVSGSGSLVGWHLVLFDVAGRRLARPGSVRVPGLGVRWSTRDLPGGTYFLRLVDANGQPSAVRRVTVVR
jgi:hypothetical protein